MKHVYQTMKPMTLMTLLLEPSHFLVRPSRTPRPILATVRLWQERRRTRRQLSALDDRQLADVGLSRSQQRSECAKSFWQL